jgi:UDP-N-acetylmuramoyl-L-alanyl-D-glutamate--2,6-diaminopimelate ligase
MELTKLLDSVSAIQIIGNIQRNDVSGIYYDSRKVVRDSIFVAIEGFKTNGHKFILDAINKGACAVVLKNNDAVPDEIFIHKDVAKILVRNSRKALAELSHSFFNEPSNKLRLIGITGTNGKTTTAFIIKNIFDTAGEKTGLLGTIANYIGEKEIKSKLTTPESSDLNELIYKMYTESCSTAVMEVSSHSLVLERVYGLNFSTAVFTNITSDHMDFHKTFENYFAAKKILFDSLNTSAKTVYNRDDINGEKIVKDSKAKLFSYGTSPESLFKIKDVNYDLTGTNFLIEYKNKNYSITSSLVGEFNALNITAAFAVGIVNGVNEESIIKGIKNTKQVPGRFEVIGRGKKKIIIDYSHTADSLEKALATIRNIVGKDIPVYTVFGCGGDRDKTKRPVMGRIASERSEKVFITSDNPRFEDPLKIIEEIKIGITKNNYEIFENREEAIKNAINKAEDNAVILIAGKGHETYQEINEIRYHFSDKEIAEKYLPARQSPLDSGRSRTNDRQF